MKECYARKGNKVSRRNKRSTFALSGTFFVELRGKGMTWAKIV